MKTGNRFERETKRNYTGELLEYFASYFSLAVNANKRRQGKRLPLMDLAEELDIPRSTCYRITDSIFDDYLTLDNLQASFRGTGEMLRLVRENLTLLEIPSPGKRAKKVIVMIESINLVNICNRCVFYNSRLLTCNLLDRLAFESEAATGERKKIITESVKGLDDRISRLGKTRDACKFYSGKRKPVTKRKLKRTKNAYECPREGCSGILSQLPIAGQPVTCSKCGSETVFSFSAVKTYETRVDVTKTYEQVIKKNTGITITLPQAGKRTRMVVDGKKLNPRVEAARTLKQLTLSDSQNPSMIFPGNMPVITYNRGGKRRQLQLHEVSTITVGGESAFPRKFMDSMNEMIQKNESSEIIVPFRPVKWNVISHSGISITKKKKETIKGKKEEEMREEIAGRYYRSLIDFLLNFPFWWEAIISGKKARMGKSKIGKKNYYSPLGVELQELGNKLASRTWKRKAAEKGQYLEMITNNLIIPFIKEKAARSSDAVKSFQEEGKKLVILDTGQRRVRRVEGEYWGSIARAHDCFTCLINGITWFLRNDLMEINIKQGVDKDIKFLFFHKPRKHGSLGPHLDLEEYGRTLLRIQAVKALVSGEIETWMFRKHWDPRAGFYYRLHDVDTVESIAKRVMKTETGWVEDNKVKIGKFEQFHARYVAGIVEVFHEARDDLKGFKKNLYKLIIPLPAEYLIHYHKNFRH